MQLLQALSSATTVELSNFKALSDAPMVELVTLHGQGLTNVCLDFTRISDLSLEMLAIYAPSLRQLSVKACRNVTDKGLMLLGKHRGLEGINCSYAAGVTDEVVTSLCRYHSLRAAILNSASITDKGMEALASCPHLEEVSVLGAKGITSKGLQQLGNGCPALRHVCVAWCEQISDGGVVGLAEGCRGLLKLRLDGCRRISNPSIKALARFSKRLRHLSLQNLPRCMSHVVVTLVRPALCCCVPAANGGTH
eukprot:scaffold7671_cov417-Prasinococcus_capsulatus_cf.AAC.2